MPHKHNDMRNIIRVYYAVSDTTPPPVGMVAQDTHTPAFLYGRAAVVVLF